MSRGFPAVFRGILPWIAALCVGLAPGLSTESALAGRTGSIPHVEILSCNEVARAIELARIRIRLTAGAGAVSLSDLQCGAFRPGTSNVLFLNPVEEQGTLAPRESRQLHAVFPRNAAHSECRCVMPGAFRMGSLGDFEGAMWETVSGLGDRDTTCAIVGGIVALYLGPDGLPARWLGEREPLGVRKL